MMRSLFSGVAGLKTHQTRMDVIGNNIANVNTTAYKSQSMTFSDIMYQTTQNASGASETRGGVNARQIGLGVQTSAISTAIEQQGASQTTNNPFDIMISGSSFFVVNNGQEQLYTRDGTFYVDGAGNLAMQSTGYLVQGWSSADGKTVDINAGIGKLQLMNAENMSYPPAATTKALMTGNIDQMDTNVTSKAGRVMTLEFYDDRGYLYTAKFNVKQMKNPDGKPMTTSNIQPVPAEGDALYDYYDVGKEGISPKNEPMYSVTLADILDKNNQSIGISALAGVSFGSNMTWEESVKKSLSTQIGTDASDTAEARLNDDTEVDENGVSVKAANGEYYLKQLKSTAKMKDSLGNIVSSNRAGLGGEYFGLSDAAIDSYGADATFKIDGDKIVITSNAKSNILTFNADTGALVKGADLTLKFDDTPPKGLESFKSVAVDTSTMTNVNTNGSSTFKATKGDLEGNETGRMVGELNGIAVETSGKIYASYSNGQTKLLGQIATAEFANASGLEKGGDNLYRATNNSGAATIQDITVSGGKMNTGVLEMSNVDLSNEFTTMITTQRGFQANSRIITVSDTLLEELTNLKR
ncbi:MAG: flagellar hook-basal body complex protein [Lachnospiraceae bacterium]|nr:flagellar hook-basal body complex protein [Lachnospiraceae bacterium]